MSTEPTHAFTVDILGTAVAVCTEGPDGDAVAEQARESWAHLIIDAPSLITLTARVGEPDPNSGTLVAGETIAETLELLTGRLTIVGLAKRAGQFVMLHAGGVQGPDGRVIALVGPTGMGKTTATQALASSGFTYVTDETVAIDEDLKVWPYPKPLSVLSDQWPGKRQLNPISLGLTAADPAARPELAAVALLDRSVDPVEPELWELPTPEAIAQLAEQSSFLAMLDKPLHRLAAVIQATGRPAQVLTYSDTASLVAMVTKLMEPVR